MHSANTIPSGRQRLERRLSFIFNGLDGCNLIFVPENFKNEKIRANDTNPIMASPSECQIYVSSKAIANLAKFFDSIQIESKDAKSFKLISKKIDIGAASKGASRKAKDDKSSEGFAIDFSILSCRDDLLVVYESSN